MLRRTELEERRALAPAEDLPQRLDRLERAFANEQTSSMSLNVRGTALAATSALAILLVAQFSAVWLDDNAWRMPDIPDAALQMLLPLTAAAFAACAVVSVIAVWPRRAQGADLRDRVDCLREGAELQEAALVLGMVEDRRTANERRSRLLRIASIPFVLAVLASAAQGMVFAFVAEPADPPRAGAPSPAEVDETGLSSPEEQLRLAHRHAPRVWLHHDERFGPLDPGAFVRGSRLGWRNRRGTERVAARGAVAPARLGRGCDSAPRGCYASHGFLARELTRPFGAHRLRASGLNVRRGFALDLDNSLHRGESPRNPTAPVYFELRRTPDELLVTYWFFYAYSAPHTGGDGRLGRLLRRQLSHEGDWENIDVALRPDGSAPVAIYFYGHGAPTRRPWTGVGHPDVYSALDSHASYGEPGRTQVCSDLGCSSDIRSRGFRWDTSRDVRPVRGEPWYGFGGAWGAAGPVAGRTGPLGPSHWKLP